MKRWALSCAGIVRFFGDLKDGRRDPSLLTPSLHGIEREPLPPEVFSVTTRRGRANSTS